jgi:hypothetical protein
MIPISSIHSVAVKYNQTSQVLTIELSNEIHTYTGRSNCLCSTICILVKKISITIILKSIHFAQTTNSIQVLVLSQSPFIHFYPIIHSILTEDERFLILT